jgi:hypothetical protein
MNFCKSVTGNCFGISNQLPQNALYTLYKPIYSYITMVTDLYNIQTYILFFSIYVYNDMLIKVKSLSKFVTVLLVACVYRKVQLPVTEPQKSIKNQTTL